MRGLNEKRVRKTIGMLEYLGALTVGALTMPGVKKKEEVVAFGNCAESYKGKNLGSLTEGHNKPSAVQQYRI